MSSFRREFFSALSIGAAVCLAAPSVAQDNVIDVEAIDLPDFQPVDEDIRKQGYKFFYFHHPDVTFEEAQADLVECRRYLAVRTGLRLPAFVPFEEASPPEPASSPQVGLSPFGLVGAAISAIVAPKLERGVRNNRLRRCMTPRGYDRYPVDEEAWNALNPEEDEERLVAMQAKLASGPKPDLEVVTR